MTEQYQVTDSLSTPSFLTLNIDVGHRSSEGRYTPVHPEKYRGDPTRIFWRSSWEYKFMKKLDHDPSVLLWQSEEFYIPYISPKDRRRHRYFPDFWFQARSKKNGQIYTYVIEVKPRAQTLPPSNRRRTQKYLNEVMTYGINRAKWESAQAYCAQRGWIFKVVTEKELFPNR